MGAIVLKGITWGHSRGITPLLAASQRYTELHPDVEIQWQKRSLQAFADAPIEELTTAYDLLIIDHPWVGCAAATGCVLPLNKYLSTACLNDQENHSVGYSHFSYQYNGSQWALAIDAATPAASYRKDLLQANHGTVPQTWEELIVFTKTGRVAIPAIPIDILMNFYTFCIANGSTPFQNKEEVVNRETGLQAINMMKELYGMIDKKMYNCNPIAVAELMTATDNYWYCPFAYCYSNYSRKGYAANILQYADVVSVNGAKLRTTIGGTGLAVSVYSANKEAAINFATYVVSGECQSTLYVQHGGQPGHLSAWQNKDANRLTHDFFTTILPVMQNGYVRPRYNGYLHFQDKAGYPLQQCLLHNSKPGPVLDEMNQLYRQSIKMNPLNVAV